MIISDFLPALYLTGIKNITAGLLYPPYFSVGRSFFNGVKPSEAGSGFWSKNPPCLIKEYFVTLALFFTAFAFTFASIFSPSQTVSPAQTRGCVNIVLVFTL